MLHKKRQRRQSGGDWLPEQLNRDTCKDQSFIAKQLDKCRDNPSALKAKCSYKPSGLPQGQYCVYDVSCEFKTTSEKTGYFCKGKHVYNRILCCDYVCSLA